MFNPTESASKTAERPAPAELAFGVGSPNLNALDSAITRLEAAERLARNAEAARVAALAEIDLTARLEAAAELGAKARVRAAEDSLAYRAARAEAATVLHLSEQATADHLARAAALSAAYPATVAVLESGEISMRHASVILEAGSVIGPVELPGDTAADALDTEFLGEVALNRAAYESAVLVEAVKTTPNRLAPIARSIAERYALEDLDARHERARATRKVWLTPRDEGMVEIGALLPAHEGTAVVSRLTAMAKLVKRVETRESYGDSGSPASDEGSATQGSVAPFALAAPGLPRRTLPEIKADLLVDLLLNGTGDTSTGGPGSGTGISGIIQLITHAGHLVADVDTDADADAPGAHSDRLVLPELEGYGSIPVSMARDIAAEDGAWSTVNVNLRTGEVLAVDTYRPSAQIRRFLAARDQRCRFPGCRVPVHRCDFDHTVDAAIGGPTSSDNLGALCRGHHILKHHSAWDTKQYANGDYEWTSPTGRTHVDEPVSRVRFVLQQVPDVQGRTPLTTKVPDGSHPF